MEFDEEQVEIQLPPNYDNSSSRPITEEIKTGAGTGGGFRYRECLRNHAVNINGHALDGCGEFMAAGDDGTLDSLKCAACNCHRNFHRKEPDGQFHHHQQIPPPYHYHHHRRPIALPSTWREDQEDMSNPRGGSGSRKRYRTKFTAEQKEKMLGFAERIGWRIQKTEEAAVQQFCTETGVKRQVLKVWMHNNKHTLGTIINPN